MRHVALVTMILMAGSLAWAEYSVLVLQGEVTVEEKVLNAKSKVASGALVESKDSSAHIVLRGTYGDVALMGQFQFEMPELTESGKKKEILARLLNGRVRVRVPKDIVKKNQFHVRTPTAVVRVQGQTDFYLSYVPLMNESEVICFENSVTFADADNKSRQTVKGGHWGGLGGRFGSRIVKPLKMSEPVLEHFKREVSLQ